MVFHSVDNGGIISCNSQFSDFRKPFLTFGDLGFQSLSERVELIPVSLIMPFFVIIHSRFPPHRVICRSQQDVLPNLDLSDQRSQWDHRHEASCCFRHRCLHE